MWANKPVGDIEALRQAIQPFLQKFSICRSVTESYSTRGRKDDLKITDTVTAAILPNGGKRINTNRNGMGRWITADYSIYAIVPEYFDIGDIITHPVYGRLKVVAIDDNRYNGAISGSLTRTGTSDTTISKDNKLYEPD